MSITYMYLSQTRVKFVLNFSIKDTTSLPGFSPTVGERNWERGCHRQSKKTGNLKTLPKS